ncbi:MAG: hypothetical protein A3H91_10860 [Gammaproteobacteria bacterium RIFCSPLOWO2_02_FULL_61_13]|nr:MAG: hypothetical protein A3H91_10860 [Gammaproteobacteria bacterium RIFCSPLOWO2_02_FULL_61_13]
MDLNPFIHNLAQFRKHLLLIWAVHTAVHEIRARSDVASVFIGPFHNLLIPISWFHLEILPNNFLTFRT